LSSKKERNEKIKKKRGNGRAKAKIEHLYGRIVVYTFLYSAYDMEKGGGGD
jgi:hypothetical protein